LAVGANFAGQSYAFQKPGIRVPDIQIPGHPFFFFMNFNFFFAPKNQNAEMLSALAFARATQSRNFFQKFFVE